QECPPYHRVPVGRALLCAPPQAPGAFINDACIIKPFRAREQVQPNRELSCPGAGMFLCHKRPIEAEVGTKTSPLLGQKICGVNDVAIPVRWPRVGYCEA